MTAPHYTSKITSFEDLVTDKLQSYGFRGEALNALCSISDLEIVTKSSSDVAGTFAIFDKMGNPTKQSSVAATVGTAIRWWCRLSNNDRCHTLPNFNLFIRSSSN